ncbi:alkaline phosphatase family protein [Alicyclobacillus acidiphilus]|uniref:alkaline phosphatase family protein n=1 Tax=Alicyclobacillus acidiphilus TaxID=182455 RepID=UPI0008297F32|nr:alkaline phosphatase family protein [Alicyclobacillus acidiphilus]
MSDRLVLVIVDGMSNQVAHERLGFVESLVERGQALRATVQSVLPSLSRVCYEAIFTGTEPIVNGILSNEIVRRSTQESLFDRIRAAGKTSAVFGYHWISELYQQAPFDHVRDRNLHDADHGITHGRFYFEDHYPDTHLYVEAEDLRRRVQPDLLVVHSMNVDDAGHKHGGLSPEYAGAVIRIDTLLAMMVPQWLSDGYQVAITADHGMDSVGYHGGTLDEHRIVPFYLLSSQLKKLGDSESTFSQVELADLICQLMQIAPAPSMTRFSPDRLRQWFHSTTQA